MMMMMMMTMIGMVVHKQKNLSPKNKNCFAYSCYFSAIIFKLNFKKNEKTTKKKLYENKILIK